MGKKTTKDANAQGVSNIAETKENASVNVKPQIVVSQNPQTTQTEVTETEKKERKPRGIKPSDADSNNFGLQVGDRVSYIEKSKGAKLFGWVESFYVCRKSGRSATNVRLEANSPVNYKRIGVYTVRLTKEEQQIPNPFVKTAEEKKEKVLTATAEVKPATAEVKPAKQTNPIMEALVTSKPIKK